MDHAILSADFCPAQYQPAGVFLQGHWKCGRSGTTASLDALNKYFGIAQMPIAGSTYWNNVHGLYADEAPL